MHRRSSVCLRLLRRGSGVCSRAPHMFFALAPRRACAKSCVNAPVHPALGRAWYSSFRSALSGRASRKSARSRRHSSLPPLPSRLATPASHSLRRLTRCKRARRVHGDRSGLDGKPHASKTRSALHPQDAQMLCRCRADIGAHPKLAHRARSSSPSGRARLAPAPRYSTGASRCAWPPPPPPPPTPADDAGSSPAPRTSRPCCAAAAPAPGAAGGPGRPPAAAAPLPATAPHRSAP